MAQQDEFELDEVELADAAEIVRGAAPGTYTLKQLYGARWRAIESPTIFGMRFKASVDAGRLQGVVLHPQKTATNAICYTIY